MEEFIDYRIKSNKVIRKPSNSIEIKSRDSIEFSDSFFVEEYNYSLKKGDSLGIDRTLNKKLISGNFDIDLKLDFHGLTIEEAFNSLLKNINIAYKEGKRFILIITGKGKGTKLGNDSIKSKIESWMKHPNISSKVIKYVDAQKKHGGSGAIYVLLKR